MRSPRELLQLAQTYRQPSKLHPIADRTFQLFEAAGDKLGEPQLAELRAQLEDLGARELYTEWMDALVSLYAFVRYANEKLDAPDAADAVTELIREQRTLFDSICEGIGDARLDDSRAHQRLAVEWGGDDDLATRTAPALNARPPEGSVRASVLKPIARPPPHLVRRAAPTVAAGAGSRREK